MVLRFLFGLSLAALIVSCDSGSKTESVSSEESLNSQKPDARTIYVVNCSSCHGEDGTLGASQAADLSKSKLNDAEILKMINKGNDKGMMPYEEILSLQERKAIVEFVKSLRK
jgi:mono/diheme cytochrome c family protein